MWEDIPRDPHILLSLVNTELRDRFSDPEAWCDDYGVSPEELKERLEKAGYRYDPERNQFV